MDRESKTFRRCAIVAAAACGMVACSQDFPLQPTRRQTLNAAARVAAPAAQNQLIETIRDATAKYHRVDAAVADGYVVASPCEAIPEGGIGVHYRRSALFDAVVDPAHPELLVYEPQENGNLKLVAVAFVVPALAWAASHVGVPLLGDQPFEDKRIPDWSSPPFPTYELHVWVWKHNPNGMYATTNPTVSCETGS